MIYIYEFCTDLVPVRKGNRWVCGGYNGKIDLERSNYPGKIPKEISDAVKRGDFAIHNYNPPKLQETALIARDLGQYSVLAIATGEIDDKGERGVTGYRYFWIVKSDIKDPTGNNPDDLDGVGTLLEWWLQAKNQGYQVWFDIDKNAFENVKNNPYQYEIYSTRSIGLNNNRLLVQNLQPIQPINDSHPLLLEATINKISLTVEQLHSLALSVSHLPRWAWNVGRLEHPERFNVIYCADETALNNNSRFLLSQSAPAQNFLEELPYDKISEIKACVARVVGDRGTSNLSSDYSELLDNLERFMPTEYAWEVVCDKTKIGNFILNRPTELAVKYAMLMALILWEREPKLQERIKSLDREKKGIARQFLQKILQVIKSYQTDPTDDKEVQVALMIEYRSETLIQQTENRLTRFWKRFKYSISHIGLPNLRIGLPNLRIGLPNLRIGLPNLSRKKIFMVCVIGSVCCSIIFFPPISAGLRFRVHYWSSRIATWTEDKTPAESAEKKKVSLDSSAITRAEEQTRKILNILKLLYIPDLSSEYADEQAKRVFNFLNQAKDEKEFYQREKHVRECKNVKYSGQFGNCIKNYQK